MKKNKKSTPQGLYVEVITRNEKRHMEEVDFALRELKKLVKKADLMKELRKREAYMSPSKTRRFKHNEAIKQRKRDDRKAEWHRKNSNQND